MIYRKDVLRLSEKLSAAADMDVDLVYFWLMSVGRANSKNPSLLPFVAVPGRVYLATDPDGTYTEPVHAADRRGAYSACGGPDYENLILARQEKYMD